MSSIGSNGSFMSVSYFGSEMGVEEALDDCFKKIQESLNECNVNSRNLCMVCEQDNDFQVSCDYCFMIEDFSDGMIDLLKELKKVCVQVRGKPQTDAEKNYLKDMVTRRKEEKAAIKEAEKLAKDLELTQIKE